LKRKVIVCFLMVIICMASAICYAKAQTKYNVFCWSNLQPKDISIANRYAANPISINDDSFIIEGTGDYLLCGDPTWTSKEMNTIAKAAEEKGFIGIVYDVENWDDLETLASSFENLSTNLIIHACLPYWLDLDTTERIIKSVDAIELMVYYKGKEAELTEPILKLAEKHKTKINIVYELQSPNEKYDVKDINTYDGDLKAAIKNYKQNFIGRAGLSIHGLY